MTLSSTHCAICKVDLETPGLGVRLKLGRDGPTFCSDCAKTKVTPKRMKRTVKREDILEKRYAEMRAAVGERDKSRKERDQVKDEIRHSVKEEELARIRQWSAWRRLKFCFNPFGATP